MSSRDHQQGNNTHFTALPPSQRIDIEDFRHSCKNAAPASLSGVDNMETGAEEDLPPPSMLLAQGSAGAAGSEVSDSGAVLHVSSTIGTRRKKTRAVCGVCLQEDTISDGWMQRCTSCDASVHFHCASALGLACEGAWTKCGNCSFPKVAAASSCLICLRKLSSKTTCVSMPVTRSDNADVSLVHAPCLLLSRIHRLAPAPSLPFSSPAAIILHQTVEPSSSRCCVCRGEEGEMQQCMNATCGRFVHASCAADLKLMWFATSRDYMARGDGPSKIFAACSMKHVKQDQVFCTCLRPYDTQGSTMVQCDDCRAWFHCDCLGIDDNEEDLNDLQSKQFRCSECAAKVSQSAPLYAPIFMCDVRRHWSHAKIIQPPKSNAPSLDFELPLSSQGAAVTAFAADALLLILQTSRMAGNPDLRLPICIACLSPLSTHDISHNSIFSILSRRLCNCCRSMHQSLLYLSVPAPACTLCPQDLLHPKARSVLVQISRALTSQASAGETKQLQKQFQMLERLVDAWDLTFRLSSSDVSQFHDEAEPLLGNCPCLAVIARHADEAAAISQQLKVALEQPQLDLSSVFNLMQDCRMLCCHTPYELQAASVTKEIAEISAKIEVYLGCIPSTSLSNEKETQSLLRPERVQFLTELPSFDEVANVLSAAESLHFQNKSTELLLHHMDRMRSWCIQAQDAIESGDEALLSAAAEAVSQNPPFLHPLMLAIEGKTWNIKAGKIARSDKEFSLDIAVETLARGEQLEEASLSVQKSLQQCVSSASEWESTAKKLYCKPFTREEAEKLLKVYDEQIKFKCEGANNLLKHVELSEAWYSEWGPHAEKGFEHMCSLPNLRQIISKYSQFNIQLPCDGVMANLLQCEPGQVKVMIDHSARLLTKKFASFLLKINSGGASYLIHPEQCIFSCPFKCCPWNGVAFTSTSDMLLHVSRHVEISEFSNFQAIFFRNQCTMREAADLVAQASAFDDESVTSNPHFVSLRDHISRTQEWLDEANLLVNSKDDGGSIPHLQQIVLEGVACGLYTPQLESLQKQLIISKIEEAAASSAPLSLFAIEILMNISQSLGLKQPFGKIRFQTTLCDIFASSVLQTAIIEHYDAVMKVSNALRSLDLVDFAVSLKMLSAAHPLSPMIPLLGFIGKMTEIWKEKAEELLKRGSHDSTIPFLAKTILGWMHWIRWFSASDSIAKLAEQLRRLSIDYKQQIAPVIPCFSGTLGPNTPVSYMMLLWPIGDASDLHLSNAAGDGETVSLQPRCALMAPLPPRWYTDSAPEANKQAILSRIKKLGGQIVASKIVCKRKDCDAKALTPDGFCSDACAVQHEMDLLQASEDTRIKRRSAARDALSRALSLSYRGATAAPDSINRLSAAIESSFLRAVPTNAEVLPATYFTLLQNRLHQIRSFSPGCVRGMVVRGTADEAVLNHLSSADLNSGASASAGPAVVQSALPTLPSLPVLPVLPSLPELASSTAGVKRAGSLFRKEDDGTSKKAARSFKEAMAEKEARSFKVAMAAKHHSTSYSISISGTAINELCHLTCVQNEHHHDVDMSSIPSAIVVQGRLAPAAVASFVKQVTSASGSSKFIALFQISHAPNAGCPPGLLGHVRSLVPLDRVAVAPLGDDCQLYIGLGSQLVQVLRAGLEENSDNLVAVAVLRKGKHALRR